MQRARDRRGRHGQHVDLLAHLLQPLLVAHAEALLLVDDEQAQVLELDVFREQAMGPDEDIDLAGCDAIQDRRLLLGGAKAARHLDADGKVGEAPLECLVVLQGEHGGRREHRHLLAILHRLEGGAHGHLGLAVTHVAADQTVHGLRRFHIALDVCDGSRLVVGFVEVEGVLELALQCCCRAKTRCRRRLCAGRRA